MRKRFKSQRGSYTLEAAIAFSVVFFVMLLLIYLSYVLYEQVRINAIALETAERGAIVFPVEEKDMFIGRIGADAFRTNNVYWRVIQNFNTGDSERKQKVKEYALMKLNANTANGSAYSEDAVQIQFENFIFYKKIIVNIEVEYEVPFGGIFKYFGIKSPYPIHGYAEAAVNEPAEFIRNIDLAADFVKQFPPASAFESKYREGLEKLKNLIQR